jgi:hypothetical protein
LFPTSSRARSSRFAGDIALDRLDVKGVQRQPVIYVPYNQQTPRWMGPFWNDRAAMLWFAKIRFADSGLTFITI